MIKIATKADFPVIRDMVEDLIHSSPYFKMFKSYTLTEEMYDKYISNPNEKLCILVLDGDTIVGFGAFDIVPVIIYHDSNVKIARLTYPYIKKEYRGKGFGKELNEAFEYWGKRVGAKWYSKGNSGKGEGYKKVEVIYMKEVK